MLTNSRPWEALAPREVWRGWHDLSVYGLPTVPVLAARGQADGPRVTIFGAVHGDEYEGPAAIHAFFNEWDSIEEPAGLVIGVPVANRAAWLARRRASPGDRLNLNRCFPGRIQANAQPTERLAHALFNTFVVPTDVLVDLHSGGKRMVHLPMAGWSAEDDGRAEALARIFGLDFFPWQIGKKPGVLTYEAARAGKIAIGAEWGGGGRLDPAGVGAYVEGLRRILSALGPDAPWAYEMDTRPPLTGDYARAPISGLFHPDVELGEAVEEGVTLGHLVNELGELQTSLTAAQTGIIAALAHVGWVEKGDNYVYVG